MLSQKRLKENLHYDPATGNFTWLVNKKRSCKGEIAGSYQYPMGKKYRRISVNGKVYSAHRLVFLYMTGDFPLNEVDHIDGDGCNNKWANLRVVTSAENWKNKKTYNNNTSGACGVTLHKGTGKWQAQIKTNGVNKFLGLHKSFETACTIRKGAEGWYGFHKNHGRDALKYMEEE